MQTARQYVSGLSIVLLLLLSFSSQVNAQLDSLNKYGGFESDLPSYWMKGKQTGATLSWATDQSRSLGRSLKIVKHAATADSVYWVSENMVDLWSPMINQGVDMLLGAFVRTDSININPSGEDAMWWISYTFWDSTGALIGEVKLPIDQSKASSADWMADTNQVGQTILPRNAWKLVIKFIAGKNATGTVWADDFMLVGRNGKGAGQDWNTSVGVPTGWNYWLPPIGGNDAKLANGFENTRITSEAAHTGKYSLKFDIPKGTHDAWVGTRRHQLPAGVKAGDSLKISVWVKASRLVPDSAAKYPGQWAVGFTPIFHSGWTNNAKYDEIGAKDTVFTFPAKDTAFDWTQYTLVYPVPNDTSAKAVSVRLHVYSRFQGIVYFDDLNVTMQTPTAVERIGTTVKTFALDQNYPNPFNPSTTIKYSIPENAFVKLRIYDMLGREVATLVNSEQNAGVYSATWNGENNFGAKVSSGTYIYRIEAGNFSQVRKLVLLK